jgi:glutathione S-transferase
MAASVCPISVAPHFIAETAFMSLELFHAHKSTCSQKVRLCLAEKGIRDWISRPVDISKRENLLPEYLAINPNGVVPAFRHDGCSIIESAVMCEYLDEVFTKSPRLVPETPIERAHMRAWLRFIDEIPSMAIRVPSFQNVFLSSFKTMTDEEFNSFADANPLRRGFFLKMSRNGFSALEYDIAMKQLAQTLQRINRALAKSSFLCGETYTVADACITPIVVRLEDLGLGGLMADHAQVQNWYKRMQERPSFADAYYDGTRLAPLDEAKAPVDQMKRQPT